MGLSKELWCKDIAKNLYRESFKDRATVKRNLKKKRIKYNEYSNYGIITTSKNDIKAYLYLGLIKSFSQWPMSDEAIHIKRDNEELLLLFCDGKISGFCKITENE